MIGFSCVCLPPLALTNFLHLFGNDPEPWEERCAPFRAEHSIVSYSLNVGQSQVSVLIAIWCKNKLLWGKLGDALMGLGETAGQRVLFEMGEVNKKTCHCAGNKQTVLSITQDISIAPSQAQDVLWKRWIVRSGGWGGVVWSAVFWIRHAHWNHKHIRAVATYIKTQGVKVGEELAKENASAGVAGK